MHLPAVVFTGVIMLNQPNDNIWILTYFDKHHYLNYQACLEYKKKLIEKWAEHDKLFDCSYEITPGELK